jgi:predicted Zn-dependent protease
MHHKVAIGILAFAFFGKPCPAHAQDVGEDAISLAQSGKVEEAEKLVRGALEKEPERADLWFALSKVLKEKGDEEEALRSCEKALSLKQDDVEIRLFLADLYLENGQEDSALEHYMVVLKAQPANIALKKRIAEVLMALDRNEEAVVMLEEYRRAMPEDKTVLMPLYRLYIWTDQQEKAVKVLEDLAKAEPEDTEILHKLADAYLDADRVADAVEALERVVKIKKDDAEAYCTLGKLYEWTDKPRLALYAYERCLELRPFDPVARSRALELSIDIGLPEKVRKHARVMAAGGAQYRDMMRQALLMEGAYESALGVESMWFTDNLGLDHVLAGPWGVWGVSEKVGIGARYRFHWFKGPLTVVGPGNEEEQVMAHEGGVFLILRGLSDFVFQTGVDVRHYDSGWTSVGGSFEARGEFPRVYLRLFAERSDNQTCVGAIVKKSYTDSAGTTKWTGGKVVLNTFGAEAYFSLWRELFLGVQGEYSFLDDYNHRGFGFGEVGYVFFKKVRLQTSYTYSVEVYRDEKDYYFSPTSPYHTHGPAVDFKHPVTTWFLYGVNAKLLHAVNDDSLLLSYGALLKFNIAQRHHIETSYERTDTIVGTTSTLYNEGLLRFSYVFEF